MTRLLRWISLGTLLVVLLAAPQRVHAADPMTGKWALNLAASMYDPGPPPKSAVRTCEVDGDAMQVSVDMVDSDGTPRQIRYAAKLDGTDYPITGAPNVETIALKRLGDRTVEAIQKAGGKTVRTDKVEVSADGTEMTISSKGTNTRGEEVNNLLIFDKR